MSTISEQDKSVQHRGLAAFIAEKNFSHGAEIGVGVGACMAVCLEHNPQLRFLGLDTWDGEHGAIKEKECRKRCAPYKERVTLLKGDAAIIVKGFASNVFDFAFYGYANEKDNEIAYHEKVLKLWMHKIKSGGYLIGNALDKKEMKTVLAKLGYKKISPIEILGSKDSGLCYIQLN